LKVAWAAAVLYELQTGYGGHWYAYLFGTVDMDTCWAACNWDDRANKVTSVSAGV
jgi:hypothetical protein